VKVQFQTIYIWNAFGSAPELASLFPSLNGVVTGGPGSKWQALTLASWMFASHSRDLFKASLCR
jgi:hypothetical protein